MSALGVGQLLSPTAANARDTVACGRAVRNMYDIADEGEVLYVAEWFHWFVEVTTV